MIELILDIFWLVLAGIVGWSIFTLLHFPTPPLLGTIFVVGMLRVFEYPIPLAPDFFADWIQIILGVFAASKITKETFKDIKKIAKPALLIIVWSISLLIFLGIILYNFTDLDLITSLLSASVGGLPEMTIIALDSGADVGVVVIMQTIRVILVSILFPILLKASFKKESTIESATTEEKQICEKKKVNFAHQLKQYIKSIDFNFENKSKLINTLGNRILVICIAAIGGFLFLNLGVPAGGMIGAMIFVVAASFKGLVVKPFKPLSSQILLLCVGITVSNNISYEIIDILISGEMLVALIISILVTFLTSFIITWIIHKTIGWSLPTSFLVSAPGGFTIMTTLAIKYDQDPFRVSILHLCRVVVIKIVVPFIVMMLM